MTLSCWTADSHLKSLFQFKITLVILLCPAKNCQRFLEARICTAQNLFWHFFLKKFKASFWSLKDVALNDVRYDCPVEINHSRGNSHYIQTLHSPFSLLFFFLSLLDIIFRKLNKQKDNDEWILLLDSSGATSSCWRHISYKSHQTARNNLWNWKKLVKTQKWSKLKILYIPQIFGRKTWGTRGYSTRLG